MWLRALHWRSSSISAAPCCWPGSHRRRESGRLPRGTTLPGLAFLSVASLASGCSRGGSGKQKAESRKQKWGLWDQRSKLRGQRSINSRPSTLNPQLSTPNQLLRLASPGFAGFPSASWAGWWRSKAARNGGIGCMSMARTTMPTGRCHSRTGRTLPSRANPERHPRAVPIRRGH